MPRVCDYKPAVENMIFYWFRLLICIVVTTENNIGRDGNCQIFHILIYIVLQYICPVSPKNYMQPSKENQLKQAIFFEKKNV